VDGGFAVETAEKAGQDSIHGGPPPRRTTNTKAERPAVRRAQQSPVRNNLPLNWVLESPSAVPLVM
jgi:hypothetical protein